MGQEFNTILCLLEEGRTATAMVERQGEVVNDAAPNAARRTGQETPTLTAHVLSFRLLSSRRQLCDSPTCIPVLHRHNPTCHIGSD